MVIGHASDSTLMAAIRRTAPHLIQRLRQGLSKFELVYTPHSRWPLPSAEVAQAQTPPKPLRISILDSSFNPPTLAHLGLADSLPFTSTKNAEKDYDAKLLLLSLSNADKTLKPGDAQYEQRLEMMYLLSQSMRPLSSNANPSSTSTDFTPQEAANVAIAIIDAPIFVIKSEVLRSSLKGRLAAIPPPTISVEDVELTFMVGHDTLERLFAPRYYGSEEAMVTSMRKFLSPGGQGDNSRLVSAKRAMSTGDPQQGVETLPFVKEFIDSERIAIIDLGDELSTYSSAAVRRLVGSLSADNNLADSWRRLVTKDVADYIVQERLYVTDS